MPQTSMAFDSIRSDLSKSAVYTGRVRHRRFLPVPHHFSYRIFMMYLNLDELPSLFKGRWLWSASKPNLAYFKRADYLGDPATPLKQAVSELVQRETGQATRGPICLLTHLRYFGYCFNPASFYYCFEADGTTLQAIVTDINNTPWGERHAYVLDCTKKDASHTTGQFVRFAFDKIFHVSPFMPMNIAYDWAFSPPEDALNIHMQNLISGQSNAGDKMFDATLKLNRRELDASTLAKVLVSYPLMTLTVIAAIYWQALWLWLKRVPFITHPKKLDQSL